MLKFKVIFTLLLLPCLWSFINANHSFVIENDLFLKDGVPFRILGGDLHYFRVHPQLWKDRLLRVKALGLNTIQTYVPWNLHEPRPGRFNFDGSADLLAFVKLAQSLDLLVMLRIGPYICGEWDLGGLPAWLLELEPPVKLRSSDQQYMAQTILLVLPKTFINQLKHSGIKAQKLALESKPVGKWWKKLLPMVCPLLFSAGGPVIMVQIENEYGSFANDKSYLQFLHKQARLHLGDDVIVYTTDGAATENLRDGSLREDGVFAAIDFATGSDPAAAFALQKRFNSPGLSPPLSAEFYTGWLTHWGEELAQTDAKTTAEALDDVLRLNASVVLYMVHGGTNFGFYSGANTGAGASDYQPDITSYDYDAPIGEAGDVSSLKYQEIRKVLSKYVGSKLPDPPPLPQRTAYGAVAMTAIGSLFDLLHSGSTKSKWPVPMEHLRQGSGFILYRSYLPPSVRPGSKLSVVEVYDRAQVFVGDTTSNRILVGTLERWSSNSLTLPAAAAVPGLQLDILVENMGRVNYGPFMGENKGITEAVLLDEDPILDWDVHTIGLESVEELKSLVETSAMKIKQFTWPLRNNTLSGPMFYEGALVVTQPSDTFMSLRGWSKGVTFVNGFNLGRFWPSRGPQCTLYIPGQLLQPGQNKLIILELESLSSVQTIHFIDSGDFTCGPLKRVQ